MQGLRRRWEKLGETTRMLIVVFGGTTLIVAVIVTVVLLTAGPNANKAPVDFDPNIACHSHGGVTSVHGGDYAVGATCKDGFYASNPYDN